MMKQVLLLAFLFVLPWQSFAKEVTYLESVYMQDSALIDRLNVTLKSRIQLLNKCQDTEFLNYAQTLTSSIDQAKFDDPAFQVRQKKTIGFLLDTLKKSKSVEASCLGKPGNILSIRKVFFFSQNSENLKNPLNRLWWKTLEPACYKIRLRGNLNNVDGNACFAGDRLMNASFDKLEVDGVRASLQYSYALLAAAAIEAEGGELNLEKVFQDEFMQERPKLLFTLIAAIGSSGPSGLTGWLQGLEDRMLISDINAGLSNEKIYQRFSDFQHAKFNYIVFRGMLDQKKIQMKMYGTDVSAWNRHNFMAAFIGCANGKTFGERTSSLVYLTGVAYEAKDFVSHLREGAGLKASKENFNVDSNRYAESGQFGFDQCNP